MELAGVEPVALEGDAEVSHLVVDSRQVKPGDLFVCVPGSNLDSNQFIPSAVQNGARAVLVHDSTGLEAARQLGAAVAFVEGDFNEAAWRLGRAFHSNPSAGMTVIGVTGTNGKTTTAWLLRDMLNHVGKHAAYLGTLGLQTPESSRELNNTTPLAFELNNILAEVRDSGADVLAMEVSSHALEERRADGVEFDAAVFTNLTQDHLDFHGSMNAYGAAKLRLFTDLPKQTSKRFVGAINVDDPVGARWAREVSVPLITYGLGGGDLRGTPVSVLVDGITMELACKGERVRAEVTLGGNFNLYNCLSAAAGFMALGYSLQQAAEALEVVHPVPGRFEAVRNDKRIGVIVDYAHTPDALMKLLDSVRELKPHRIIAVFGCGGDRDRNKRPKMARATSERAELTVVTSDNPRTEDPNEIIKEVLSGIGPGRDVETIVDRREAIQFAVGAAKPGDIVVIAGKGHENYQIIGRAKYPMDDREMARDALEALP
jgi:UDP-N-acetylmuramoyl-L-alanyl-D-glutamate--2,6-diaminopimelate ligase